MSLSTAAKRQNSVAMLYCLNDEEIRTSTRLLKEVKLEIFKSK